ncbi:peptidoglycan-binding domain-containing protein [Anatilimnocola floriformis]|uniref:peptidoglycan-binding domain-containing protein n=1 Tax=Anatilimnocola floriformis TaxID=2948575 RepID=UPI0020C4D1CB|nr:peptidoglycan-binding domain-containing protein [Anatilimnocola floriformis]
MLKSQLFRGDTRLQAAADSNPGHIVPGDRGEHVKKIQLALNQLDNAGLNPDGIYGQKTANAVLAYKQKRGIINHTYQNEADNIVGIMTMKALDEELPPAGDDGGGEVAFVGMSASGVCEVEGAKKGSGPQQTQQPSAKTLIAIPLLEPKVRIVIAAATFKLNSADQFVKSNEKLVIPTGPFQANARSAVKLLIDVFSLDKHKNPRPGFENIRRVFFNMNVALNRSFETDPLIAPLLFVPNTLVSQEKVAFAYTSAGGAFLKSSKTKLKGLGVPADRIYICDALMKENELFQISTMVHELAHFVSGQPILISHDHGVPKGGQFLKGAKDKLDKITPEAKLRSPEHYAFFAMIAGFKRLDTD